MHRKNLAKRINTMLTILLLLLLIPLFLTIFCQKMQLEKLLGNVNRTAEKEEDADMLFCIVAKEISADAPEECIKAQCVIARTNLKAAEETGIDGNVSCHSLRKTFGYHAWKQGVPPAMLMMIYNHSSYQITKRYLGIIQEEKDDVFYHVQL